MDAVLQVADGVRSLHQENIIHRDLACRNVLVDENLDVYVSDFGFARQKENKTSKVRRRRRRRQRRRLVGLWTSLVCSGVA